MLTPENMSYLDIAIHNSKIPAFLNEVPKYKIHIAEFKESKDRKHHHIRREHKFHDDLEMIQHKINEIEESIIYYFQELNIDPKKIHEPLPTKRIFFQVSSVNDAIDQLHDKTTNETRRIRAYKNTIDKFEKELIYNLLLKDIYIWLTSYSANIISFEWFDQLEFRLFYGSSKDFIDMEVILEHEEIPTILEYREIDGEITAFFMIYNHKHHEKITEICHNAKELKDFEKSFDEKGVNLEQIEKNIEFAKDRLEKAHISIERSKGRSLKFRAYMELLDNIKKFELLESQFRKVYASEIVRIEAFIPSKEEESVCNALDEKFHNHIRISAKKIQRVSSGQEKKMIISKTVGTDSEDYEYISEREDSTITNVPSLVRPNKFAKPFMLLTKLYGTANYAEADPTALVAITYPLIFGLMFGDVGHGLVLAIAGILMILANSKHKDNSRYDAGFLLFWLGFAAIIGGLLYGEFFGQEFMLNGEHIIFFKNPMEEVTIVLKATIIVGVSHLSLGWLVSMSNYWRQKKRYLAIADPFFKILVLIGGTILIFRNMFNIQAWVAPPYPILFPIVPTIFLLFMKPLGRLFGISYLKKESMAELIGEQTIDVGETYLGILSNVASYSRILALAMAHMGLMLVVETIADIFLEKGTVGATIAVIVILIFGNLFVIVLETLLSAIHALRLTFYEFFGKFYHADGVPYKYVKIDKKYSNIEFS